MKKMGFLAILMGAMLFNSSLYAETAKTMVNKEVQESHLSTSLNKININTATAEQLTQKLKGIGIKKAQKIVTYREKYGEFTDIEQLKEVSGIGDAIFEKNRELITIEK